MKLKERVTRNRRIAKPGASGAWNRDVPRMAEVAKKRVALNLDAESGCESVGVVPGDGGGGSVGDQPDAAEGDRRRSERAGGGMTASARAVCACQVVRTTSLAGGERAANKILFGTQMCTYNPCRGNKRKGIEDFWE